MIINYSKVTADKESMMKKVRILIVSALLTLGCIPFGIAQDASTPTITPDAAPAPESDALKTAFANRNTDEILAALNAAGSDAEKAALEGRVLAEAKAAAFSGDLDTASKYSETVVVFDFANNEAQDLYLSVEAEKTARANLLAKQKADAEAKAKAEEQKRLEAAEQEKVLKAQQELHQKEVDEQKEKDAFISSVQKIGRHNFTGSVFVSPLGSVLLYRSAFADDYNDATATNIGLRIPVGGELEFNHPYVHAAINGRAGFTPISFGDAGKLADCSILASVGTPLIHIPLCIAAGVMKYWFPGDDSSDTMLVTGMLSPTVGLSIDHLDLGKTVDVSASAVWLAGTTGLRLVDRAFAGEVDVRVKLFEMAKCRFFVTPSVSGVLVTGGSKIEWMCKPAVYAGVILK